MRLPTPPQGLIAEKKVMRQCGRGDFVLRLEAEGDLLYTGAAFTICPSRVFSEDALSLVAQASRWYEGGHGRQASVNEVVEEREMNRISTRLLVALLTFMIGVASFAVWLFLWSPHDVPSETQESAFSADAARQPGFTSRYENPATRSGLFYATRRSGDYILDPQDGYDERALVISYDDKPIKSKANDADVHTVPGFYLSDRVRLNFERVEIVGGKVYFKTVSVGGVSYEFSGFSGEEVVPTIDATTKVPFIKGILSRSRDGKLEGEEEIKFRYTGAAKLKR